MRFEILRDPLWNNIRVDELALQLIDTGTFQRLRYVRQLGLAFLVYPGATHSRFEHALGAHHLARNTLALLAERDEPGATDPEEQAIVRAAALLHDVGHYPFSHALEEIGQLNHEDVAQPLIREGEIAEVLSNGIGKDAPARVYDLIRGSSSSALQGLISGSLDLDKIDYLKRDAFKTRRLYKRSFEQPASRLDADAVEWIATDRERTREAEDRLAAELGLAAGEALLDFPAKTQMLGLDIPVRRRSGAVERLTSKGWPGTIDLPRLSEELYTSARWLRVFTTSRVTIPPSMLSQSTGSIGSF